MRKLLEVIGALSNMSGLGNCYDNAKAEAFFSTLKAECFPLSNCFQSKAQARSTIFEYIEVYYNNQRLHSALGYKSPSQYESGLSTRKRTSFSKEVPGGKALGFGLPVAQGILERFQKKLQLPLLQKVERRSSEQTE